MVARSRRDQRTPNVPSRNLSHAMMKHWLIRLSKLVRISAVAISLLAMNASVALAADDDEEEKKSYVVVYLIMICSVGLALSLICRTGAKPRTTNVQPQDDEE